MIRFTCEEVVKIISMGSVDTERWIDTMNCIICEQENMKLGDPMDKLNDQIQSHVTNDDIFDVTIIMKKK